MADQAPDILPLADAGKQWLGGVSRRTVERLIRDRKLKVTKIRGGSFLTRRECERYIEQQARGRLA